TVIFTSHDREFMGRIATCVIEVRDGHVTNYRGDYEAYVYSVNKEIEEGEREEASARSAKAPASAAKGGKTAPKVARRDERTERKEIQNLERTTAKLDSQKKELAAKLNNESNPDEAMRLHNEVTAITSQLEKHEHRWCELQEEL